MPGLLRCERLVFISVLHAAACSPNNPLGTFSFCGDGVLDRGETCDDGNTRGADGCVGCKAEAGYACSGTPSTCVAICGDGILLEREACDDGNSNSTDGCDACSVRRGWTCPRITGATCTPICGDGSVIHPETCDDGNAEDDDGCSATCLLEAGWNCSIYGQSSCTEICGDGNRVGRETCDDGNQDSGDGCSPACTLRGFWRSLVAPNAPPAARDGHSLVWTGSHVILWGGETPATTFEGARFDPRRNLWSPIAAPDRLRARHHHTAIWTGDHMVVFGGLRSWGPPLDLASGILHYQPSTDTWEEDLEPGIAARYEHTSVWTGSEMLVWGGRDTERALGDGGLYDPVAKTWRPISTFDAPSARAGHTAVWTGAEMIVFGGVDDLDEFGDGAAYDPSADAWRPLSMAGAPAARTGHVAVWTGAEMIVFGGTLASIDLGSAHAYDPDLDRWRALPSRDAPVARRGATATWTGSEMIVWGGAAGSTRLGDGARYIPAIDRWASLPLEAAPSPRRGHQAVWLDDRVFVWGGGDFFDSDPQLGDGALYDPEGQRWTPVASDGAVPAPRTQHTGIWSGRELIIWGGQDWWPALGTGARYDPAQTSWRSMSNVNAPAPRYAHSSNWLGDRLMVFGGDNNDRAFGDGALYAPAEDRWTALPPTGAPSPRALHTAVWTGSEVLVWGGWARTSPTLGTLLGSGASFSPATQQWSALPSSGAPSPRFRHSAVWTGSEMLVFGGLIAPAGGGMYNPTTRRWRSMADSRLARRFDVAAVWTGDEMVVWGGRTYDDEGNPLETLDDGAAFDPVTNTWRPISMVDAPSRRSAAVTVWTGTQMVVWGGAGDDYETALGDGARYEPSTDTWVPIPPDSLAVPRFFHTGAWTGESILYFGGKSASTLLGAGVRLDL